MGERKSMRIQGGAAGLGLVGEVAFVPEGALVVEECGALGVPVAGDFEGGGLGEVVFEARAGGGGVVFGVVGGAVEVGVEDEVPVAVEREGGAAVEGDEEGGGGRGRCGGSLARRGVASGEASVAAMARAMMQWLMGRVLGARMRLDATGGAQRRG